MMIELWKMTISAMVLNEEVGIFKNYFYVTEPTLVVKSLLSVYEE